MTEETYIGRRVPKRDALAKAQGKIAYTHDIRRPRMLHGKILFAEHAHARIVSIDTSAARAMPGVKAVLTAADVQTRPFGYAKDNVPLKGDRVRCLRDEVAAVAAVDEETARAACAAIRVVYEPLPAVFSPDDARALGAPVLHEKHPDNVFVVQRFAHGDVDAAFAAADVIVDQTFHLPHVSTSAMETCCCVAEFDNEDNLLLHSPTQIPFLLQKDLSETLGIPGKKVRILQSAVGGAFGKYLDIHPYEVIAALLARTCGRPVRVQFDRREEFRALPPRQPARFRLRTAASKDGLLLGRDADILLDNGAYVSWGAVTPLVMLNTVTSLYRVPAVRAEITVVYTNNPYTGAVRGFGNPQSTFAVESQMDEVARRLGIDRLEFRLRNVNRPGETTPQKLHFTTCGLAECLREAADAIGWSSPPRPADGPWRHGRGIAGALNVGGGARIYRSDGCGAIVKIDDFARVTLVTGSSEIGQGSETVLAQIVAEVLRVPLEDVQIANSDTDIKPWDVGVHASRTTFIAGRAAAMAAQKARDQVLAAAERMTKTPAKDLALTRRGIVCRNNPDLPPIPLAKVVRAAHFRAGGNMIVAEAFYDPPNEMQNASFVGNISATYGFAAQAAEVAVDVETGKVKVLKLVAAQDVGRAINPMLVEGQMEGGMVMGIGYALTEELRLREGRICNDSFLDYRIPTALDVPPMECRIIETDDPEGPFGAKGVGELGIVPTAAAIANAIADAIGRPLTALPADPERVLAALDNEEPTP